MFGRLRRAFTGPARHLSGRSDAAPRLTGYLDTGATIDIRPAPLERDWMVRAPERFPHRCLPLNMANTCGWEILCDAGLTAIWNGGDGADAISIEVDGGATSLASSHFGHGVLTFSVPCLFATDAGFDLMVQGPVNRPKDAIAPLTGLVETDWSPYSFTMNWLFTRPHTSVRFEKGEPFCHVFPLRRGDVESFQPAFRPLTDNPALKIQHDSWSASRDQFNADLKRSGTQAQDDKWQKRYYHGLDMEGRPIAPDHRTRIRVKPFTR